MDEWMAGWMVVPPCKTDLMLVTSNAVEIRFSGPTQILKGRQQSKMLLPAERLVWEPTSRG